jgi:peptidoglycan/xylan/chitin deacetylase (PgdA/CDA1 family)
MNLKIVLACFLLLLALSLSIFLVAWIVDRPQPKKSQHNVIVSFDDNPSDYLPAIGIMKQYGFVGGVACVIVTGSSISTLKTFVDAGWEIASHSMSHPSNTTSLSDSQLDYEIRQSKVTLEQELPECAPVITFTYPWNNYDERVESVVAQYDK